MIKHEWLYFYPASPLGWAIGWNVIIYVGITNSPWHRRRQHRRSSWRWLWMTWGVPVVLPMPSRAVAARLEELSIRLLRTPGNREHNPTGGLRPRQMLVRAGIAAGVLLMAWPLVLGLLANAWALVGTVLP